MGIEYEERFERKFWEVMLKEALEVRGMSKGDFAARLFPKLADPKRAFYAVSGTTSTGVPQRVTLAQAIRCCNIIGEDFPMFMFRIKAELQQEGL